VGSVIAVVLASLWCSRLLGAVSEHRRNTDFDVLATFFDLRVTETHSSRALAPPIAAIGCMA
jgi:hypothetical protein